MMVDGGIHESIYLDRIKANEKIVDKNKVGNAFHHDKVLGCVHS